MWRYQRRAKPVKLLLSRGVLVEKRGESVNDIIHRVQIFASSLSWRPRIRNGAA